MTSHPEFGLKTSALEVAKVFADVIKGRNILITGIGPKGVGEGTAVAFASQSPNVLILASRTKEKLEDVASQISSSYPGVNVKLVSLDLSSQDAIRKAANEINNIVDKLDILINNAAVVVLSRQWTPEKIELQFGTNHIGPFLLTNLLLPMLLKAARSSKAGSTRIVNVSSHGHRLSPIRFHDWNFEGHRIPSEEEPFSPLPPAFAKKAEDGYPGFIAYGQSKTANILFTAYLQEHLKCHGITSYSLHPGGVSTGLGRNLDKEGAEAIERTSNFWKTPDQGASTTMVAALDPALNQPGGLYMDNCQFARTATHASDPKTAERLWLLSEQLVGNEFSLESKL